MFHFPPLFSAVEQKLTETSEKSNAKIQTICLTIIFTHHFSQQTLKSAMKELFSSLCKSSQRSESIWLWREKPQDCELEQLSPSPSDTHTEETWGGREGNPTPLVGFFMGCRALERWEVKSSFCQCWQAVPNWARVLERWPFCPGAPLPGSTTTSEENKVVYVDVCPHYPDCKVTCIFVQLHGYLHFSLKLDGAHADEATRLVAGKDVQHICEAAFLCQLPVSSPWTWALLVWIRRFNYTTDRSGTATDGL